MKINKLKFRAWNADDMTMSEPMTMRKLLTYSPIDNDTADSLDVMQFTGLTDCNGVEIYEGDIVLTPDDKLEVYYDDAEASFWLAIDGDHAQCALSDFSKSLIEIIGNIHQHKHLLDGAVED